MAPRRKALLMTHLTRTPFSHTPLHATERAAPSAGEGYSEPLECLDPYVARRRPLLAPLLAIAATAMPLAACSDLGLGGDTRYASDRDGYVLGRNDQIYRDDRGNYYCRRPDGRRGLIIGGLAGGVLGNIIAPNGSKTLGTIIGAAGGAVAGDAIEKGQMRCR